MATSKKIRVFSFHGIELGRREGIDQAVGDCLFCGRKGHFYVNENTGQWDCKDGKCARKGNVHSFLTQLHELCFEGTKPRDYKELEKWRKIPAKVFKDFGLAKDGNDWLIPVYNQEGRLVNLHLLRGDDKEKRVLSTPTCSLHLIGLHNWKERVPIYLCEGFWDTYAMSYLTTKLKSKVGDSVVLGVPGSTTFKPDWATQWFEGRTVYLLFDNDPAGDSGIQRVGTALSNVARKVVPIHWPMKVPSGADINDVVANASSLSTAWKQITAMLNGVKTLSKSTKKVLSFRKVITAYKRFLHVDKNMEDALAVVFAVAISIKYPGDPLWLFLVGPPGAGKTAFLKSMGGAHLCYFLSRLTAHSLISGFKTVDGSDPSQLPKIMGRCLILRDYTEIITLPGKVQDELYGVLRQCYDGHARTPFGNQITREYRDCFFSLVAGVTDIIHGDERATLGERFLKLNFIYHGHDQEAHIKAALNGLDISVGVEEEAYETVAAFLDNISLKKSPTLPAWVKERLLALSQLIAFLRTSVPRTKDSGLYFRSRPEIGTRVIKQFGKLLRCLVVVFGKQVVDKQVYKLLERVALDTIIGWHREIVTYLIDKHPSYVSTDDLSRDLDIPLTTLRRRLDDLHELRVVKVTALPSSKVGKKPHGFTVTEPLVKLWQRAKIGK